MSSIRSYVHNNRRLIFIFSGLFLLTLVVFVLYWLAIDPLPDRADVMIPWAEIKGLASPNTDWQPYQFAIWLNFISFGLPSSLDAYRIATVIQLLVASLILSSCSVWLIWRGLPAWLVIIGHVILLLNPITSLFAIFLLKDIPAALFVLALLFLWLHISGIELRWGWGSVLLVLLFVFVTYWASYLRHNHKFLPFLMILLVWLLARRMNWRLKLVYTVGMLAIVLLSALPYFMELVNPSPLNRDATRKAWLINYNMVNGSSSLSDEDMAFLETVIPEDKFGITGCFITDFGSRLNVEGAGYVAVDSELNRILRDELLNNPHLILSQRICVFTQTMGMGNSIYQFPVHNINGQSSFQASRGNIVIEDQTSLIPAFRAFIHSLAEIFTTPPLSFVLDTHFPSLLMIFVIGAVGLFKRHAGLIGVFIILISLVLSIFVIGTGHRYTYLAFLHFFVFYSVALALLPWFEERQNRVVREIDHSTTQFNIEPN